MGLRSKPYFPQTICYNFVMSNLKTKCYFCDRDAIYTSDYEDKVIDTCLIHFKYMYMG